MTQVSGSPPLDSVGEIRAVAWLVRSIFELQHAGSGLLQAALALAPQLGRLQGSLARGRVVA